MDAGRPAARTRSRNGTWCWPTSSSSSPTLNSTTSPRSPSAPPSSTPSNPMAWRRRSSRWPPDDALLAETRARIDEEVRKFDGKIADAKENLGEIEVCEADLAKSLVLHKGRGEGKLICMLGVCMKCMAMHPEASAVTPAILDMIRSRTVSQHPEAYVRRSVLFAASCKLIALHLLYASSALIEGNLDISTGLELIHIWALHVAEADPDTECISAIMFCLQLHFRDLQKSRALESVDHNSHQGQQQQQQQVLCLVTIIIPLANMMINVLD